MSKYKKVIPLFLHWILNNFLNKRQRKYIIDNMSANQIKFFSRIMSGAQRKYDFRHVESLIYKLNNLGFQEKAYNDLNEVITNTYNKSVKKFALFELAVWHANQSTVRDANKSLEYLKQFKALEKNKIELRRALILETESLQLIGEQERAIGKLLEGIRKEKHVDLYLGMANLQDNEISKLEWINKAMALYKLEAIELEQSKTKPYDRLGTKGIERNPSVEHDVKVSVIMPVYNAEDVITTSIRSLLKQTWVNIEIIIIDDFSTDKTVEIVRRLIKKDNRIHLIELGSNNGPYVARNYGLQIATGEYITVNDADDWSHPRKIEIQIKHLLNNKNIIGNTSQQARLSNDLKFYRRGKMGCYVSSNMSSLMFRKNVVHEKLGYWDSVRFGADSEFIRRIRAIFGEKSIVDLNTGLLSYQRYSANSLTGNSAFGFPGFFMGARKEYLELQMNYHNNSNLYYDFPMDKRPFPVPDPMKPKRSQVDKDGFRHFDVIIASDFRLDGGSTLSSLEEIKAQKKAGLKTGLIQMARYDYPEKKKINSKIREEIDGEHVQIIVFGEKVKCDLLVLRYPPILQEYQRYIPKVKAKTSIIIINQTPMSDYSKSGEVRYNIDRCMVNYNLLFNEKPKWYPIGPLVRDALYNHHMKQIEQIELSNDDWLNIIDINEWSSIEYSRKKTSNGNIRIGRHSRDKGEKWPGKKDKLLKVYPEDKNIDVRILGGAKTPQKIIGYIPDNWTVYQFDEISSLEFLQTIDIFVYFTHDDWVESFGRVIIEAMATKIPVILPPQYKPLFEDSVLYATEDTVYSEVKKIMTNKKYYDQLASNAYECVKKRFSYSTHLERISRYMERSSNNVR
ncbi:glycosyltransferase involved in cell wall biosynthesis [Natronobacillus azotifigens]|uniref:Glycosyltransferase n=1 Tax=Natronobacillus azotifigens TaxID=472978 RepID=A0A9J6RDQ7_9BACI|nr:glycosyltransferase [Natronobacillus azotifigens]MCZ0703687.1 glycosyltransferase [Natronobacillus azotifigens]